MPKNNGYASVNVSSLLGNQNWNECSLVRGDAHLSACNPREVGGKLIRTPWRASNPRAVLAGSRGWDVVGAG